MFIISDDLEAFLINLVIIFALLFYFHFINSKRNLLATPWAIGIICSIATGLCMYFSVTIFPGFIIDMRFIPFIIGSLYGGRRVAVFIFVSLLFYRFLIGHDQGFYSIVAIYPFMTLLLLYFIPHFHKTTKFKDKAFMAVFPASLGVFTLLGLLFTKGLHLSGESSLSIIPLYITQLLGIFFFIHLIERKRNELFLLDEIKQLEKLKIVSDIAASISHEVRNPLTVTRGFLQLLNDNNLSPEKKAMYISLSLQELDRADATITDYLTFAKPSLKNIEMLDLNKEIHYVIDVVNPYATLHNVEVTYRKNSNIHIIGEKQKLHQCLINLMKNGIEAMPNGGNLNISLEAIDDKALVKIEDNGIGMSPQQINRLGTPYYSTKDKGTGLGMMVVYSIVKIMGGKVKVTSKVNVGTCFTLEFPLKKFENTSLQSTAFSPNE
jgi:two-component system, sporulation sensor kinase B